LNYSSYVYSLSSQLYQSYDDLSEYNPLISHTYSTIIKQRWGLVYHSPTYIKFYQLTTYLSSKIFFLKITGICIDYIFIKQSMFIKNNSILISISRKQWMSLLNGLPHKLLTLLSTMDTTSALPHASQPKLSVSMVGILLVRLCIGIMGFTIWE